jgi:hypothetical protein
MGWFFYSAIKATPINSIRINKNTCDIQHNPIIATRSNKYPRHSI